MRGVDTPDYALAVAIFGSYAYVADASSGLQVMDITTPESPVKVGSVDTPDYAFDVAISGSYAYVADASRGLRVVDITTPESPTIVHDIGTPDYALAVAIFGSYAYIADGTSGVQVVDITTPESPTTVGGTGTPSLTKALAVSGSYVYVADRYSGLQVLPTQCDDATPTIPNTSSPMTSAPVPLLVGSPNPFSSSARLTLSMPTDGMAMTDVFDAGRRLAATRPLGWLDAGVHGISFDGRDAAGRTLPPGVWFVRLRTPEGTSEPLRLVRVQ